MKNKKDQNGYFQAVVAEEVAKLQGTWRQVACEIDGVRDAMDEFGASPRVTFDGDSYLVTTADGRIVIEGKFRIDPTQRPKAVDWIDAVGADAGKTLPAIYVLEGDRFMFCAADEGQPRPAAFAAGPGQVLRIHQREVARKVGRR
ncbi:MAG TPA: TIGR03067 domain-containing protein [Gammaproteobacteria bacterium]|nr:TIGR03067 domain-containing protein [Gammaproteobacteria bacterium]